MSQIATQVFNVTFAGESEITVFADSRIVFSIDSVGGTGGPALFVTADGEDTVMLTYQSLANKNLQANLLMDKGLKIKTYSGAANSTMDWIITTSAPGA